MRSHFHGRIDHNGVAFSLELLILDWEYSSWNQIYHLSKSVPLTGKGHKVMKLVSKMALKR